MFNSPSKSESNISTKWQKIALSMLVNAYGFLPHKTYRQMHKIVAFLACPFRIVEKTSPVNYRLTSCDERRRTFVVHVNRLKTYVDPADQPWRVAEPPHQEDPNDELDNLWDADDDLPLAELSKRWNITQPDTNEDFDIT